MEFLRCLGCSSRLCDMLEMFLESLGKLQAEDHTDILAKLALISSHGSCVGAAWELMRAIES